MLSPAHHQHQIKSNNNTAKICIYTTYIVYNTFNYICKYIQLIDQQISVFSMHFRQKFTRTAKGRKRARGDLLKVCALCTIISVQCRALYNNIYNK